MGTWLNEYDIDQAVEVLSRGAPQLAPYAVLLSQWRDVVNANSDGWSSWRGGSRPAERLMSLLKEAVDCVRYRGGEMPHEAQLRASLSPIKAVATRLGFPFPELRLAEPDVQAPAPGRRF